MFKRKTKTADAAKVAADVVAEHGPEVTRKVLKELSQELEGSTEFGNRHEVRLVKALAPHLTGDDGVGYYNSADVDGHAVDLFVDGPPAFVSAKKKAQLVRDFGDAFRFGPEVVAKEVAAKREEIEAQPKQVKRTMSKTVNASLSSPKGR